MYSRNKFLFFIFIFLFLVLTIFSITKGVQQKQTAWYDKASLFLISPFQVSFRYLGEKILYSYYRYKFLLDAEEKIQSINKTNMMLKYELNKLYELKYENTRLRRLLNFRKQASYKMIPAQIIAVDVNPNFKSVRINRGIKHGIEIGEAVVNYEGIVGRVIKVYNDYSDIILLIDNNFIVDAFVQRIRARGVLYGTNTSLADLKYIHRFENIKNGDTIVSSGFDGVFPKGLLIGKVKDILVNNTSISQKIKVMPIVSFKKLEEVFVIDKTQGL